MLGGADRHQAWQKCTLGTVRWPLLKGAGPIDAAEALLAAVVEEIDEGQHSWSGGFQNETWR